MPGKIADKILQGAREAAAHARGELADVRVRHFGVDVKRIRSQLSMTQSEFAETFSFSVDAIKHWETGRRVPEKAAQTLLKVIARDPNIVLAVLGKSTLLSAKASTQEETITVDRCGMRVPGQSGIIPLNISTTRAQ